MNIKTLVLNFGEAMNGARPADVWQFDSTVPGLKRGFTHSEYPRWWDLDEYLRTKLGYGYTFAKLQEVVEAHPVFGGDYAQIRDQVTAVAPNEWGVHLGAYVTNTGSGQFLQHGVLKQLACLSLGMDDILMNQLMGSGAKMVALFAGLTGGTGAASMLTMGPFLSRGGFASYVPIGALTHVPSIQVRGVVHEHTVLRIEQMLKLVPHMVIATMMQATREDGKNTWDDMIEMAPRLAELFSNVDKLASVHGTTPNMWLLGINYRRDLIDRWMARILATVGTVSPETAAQVLKYYIDNGFMDFGKPDARGFRPVMPKNRELLQLQHLEGLMPSLLYVKHNSVHVAGQRRGRWGVQESYEVDLKGSTLIDELLEKAGVRDISELRKDGGNEYTGLAQYETWVLNGSKGYTEAQAIEYWMRSWTELGRIYAGHAFGNDICFEPGEHIPGKGAYYAFVQPKLDAHTLAVRALSVLGTVNDPLVRAQQEEARRLREEQLQREQQAHDAEVRARLGYTN